MRNAFLLSWAMLLVASILSGGEPALIKTVPTSFDVDAVAWAPQGKTLAFGYDEAIYLWNVESGDAMRRLVDEPSDDDYGWKLSLAWSPDGAKLASATGKTIVFWDVFTGKAETRFSVGTGDVRCIAWSSNGKYLASAGGDNVVKVWPVSAPFCATNLVGHDAEITSVAWAPKCDRLVSADSVGSVKLWRVAAGADIATFKSPGHIVFCSAFNPTGASIASGQESVITLWNLSKCVTANVLKGHSARQIVENRCLISPAVNCIAFRPDGKCLASGSRDQTLKLWNACTGMEITTLKSHTGYVNSVGWSPDGKTLASGSSDHSVKIWDLRDVRP